MNLIQQRSPRFSLLLISFLSLALVFCNDAARANKGDSAAAPEASDNIGPFKGGWQGMTYGSTAYDPMFTLSIDPSGTWTDLTFGKARAIKGKYRYNAKDKTLTLYSRAGNALYTFKHEPPSADHKERLVEQRPANEAYKAMVCYRYTVK